MPESYAHRSLSTVVPAEGGWRRRLRRAVLQALRVALLAAVVWLIHDQHRRYQTRQRADLERPLPLSLVRPFFPEAVRWGRRDAETGGRAVEGPDGRLLGYVLQTSPHCDDVIGYSGPTNTLIALDTHDRIVGLRILWSGDTPEHVETVRQNRRFFQAFLGRTRQQVLQMERPDAVSGATLTSYAVCEAVIERLGGKRPSFLFPEPIRVSEIRPFLPGARRLVPDPRTPRLLRVLDQHGRLLGFAGRTAPTTDDLIGYQGPVDTLFVTDAQGRIRGIAVRKSYETLEYVERVEEDEYFMSFFNGMTLSELARLDLQQAGMEGVSGATMTSVTMAEGLVRVAQELQRSLTVRRHSPSVRLTRSDWGTLAVVLAAAVVGLTRLRQYHWLRFTLQLVLVGYLGLVNGALLSQKLWVGWAQSGLPWKSNLEMVLLTAAALAVPLFSRRQLYCHFVCPHGAVQEWVTRVSPWRARLPGKASRALRLLPALLLLVVLLTALLHWPLDLADVEPFDAYLVGIGGPATLTLALVGLAGCLWVPMFYCRFGCPTGALLSYLRLNRRSDQLTVRDWTAALLFAVALAVRFWPS